MRGAVSDGRRFQSKWVHCSAPGPGGRTGLKVALISVKLPYPSVCSLDFTPASFYSTFSWVRRNGPVTFNLRLQAH